MMKKLLRVGILLFFFFVIVFPARADYVLPYPSYMPGHKLYKISKIFENLEQVWYWGSIGKVKYHMMLSDKYLVEAKTLFEYKQYPLALRALHLSDEHITQIPDSIAQGEREGKNMNGFASLFVQEKEVHRLLLMKLETELPKTFVWTPEKEAESVLDLSGELSHSLLLRTAH